MSFGARLALAILLLALGIAAITVILILQMEGAPSWLHWISWIGGGLTAAGIGSLVNVIRSRTVPTVDRPRA